jgi:hypothetical protein
MFVRRSWDVLNGQQTQGLKRARLKHLDAIVMGNGRTEVVLLWETRAMNEQNLLVSAGNVPAGNVPAPNT